MGVGKIKAVTEQTLEEKGITEGGVYTPGGGGGAGTWSRVASALVAPGGSSGTIYTLLEGKRYVVAAQISENAAANWLAGDEDKFELYTASPARVAHNDVPDSPAYYGLGLQEIEIVKLPLFPVLNLVQISLQDKSYYVTFDKLDLLVDEAGVVTLSHTNGGNGTNGICAVFEKG